MLGVAATHVRADLGIRPGPETGKIISHGQRSTSGGEQVEQHPLPAQRRGFSEAKTFLKFHAHHRSAGAVIHKDMTATWDSELRGSILIKRCCLWPRHKPAQRWKHIYLR